MSLKDPIAAWTGQKQLWQNTLGYGTYTISGATRYYPLTTTYDVYNFGHKFYNWTQRSEDGLFEKGLQAVAQAFGAPDLVAQYERKVAAWKATWPTGPEAIANPLAIWRMNPQFWETGVAYAIERSAIGTVPSQWQYLKEAVVETVNDRVKNLLDLFPLKKWALYGLVGFVAYTLLIKQ